MPDLAAAPAYVPRVLTRRGGFNTTALVLLACLALGLLSHGWYLFKYPLYITDEGIYLQQAWSVLRQQALSPYTYFYDHAPAGWLAIAAWVQVLPGQFQTFGNALNTGRALMLVVHLASVFFLFKITHRLSGNPVAAFAACFLFSLSPLAIFYQRQVLLDNLMVFWLLLSLFLALCGGPRVTTAILGGLAFGIAVLTKENAIFFTPMMGFVLFMESRQRENSRFFLGFWAFTAFALISVYFLYAALKNELFPTGLSFDLNNPPADHVSLLYTIWWQLNRSQGSILDPDSLFWEFSFRRWLPLDTFILAAGVAAILINLFMGLGDRRQDRGQLIAGLFGLSYLVYLARGSFILEFYVLAMLPFLALNAGLLIGRAATWTVLPLAARYAGLGLFFGTLVLSPSFGYLTKFNSEGRIALQDQYRIDLTALQEEQLDFIRTNVPPEARIVMDDDLWVHLHDVRPFYPRAHSHWKAVGDPDVRDKLFSEDWRQIDYIVFSNKMRLTMEQNNADHRYDWIFTALEHSRLMWELQSGDVHLAVYEVVK